MRTTLRPRRPHAGALIACRAPCRVRTRSRLHAAGPRSSPNPAGLLGAAGRLWRLSSLLISRGNVFRGHVTRKRAQDGLGAEPKSPGRPTRPLRDATRSDFDGRLGEGSAHLAGGSAPRPAGLCLAEPRTKTVLPAAEATLSPAPEGWGVSRVRSAVLRSLGGAAHAIHFLLFHPGPKAQSNLKRGEPTPSAKKKKKKGIFEKLDR